MNIRVGIGYDIHSFKEGRPLILGGVSIPHHAGLDGHSDADALLHALTDAILGAASLGDIGQHFPPGDEATRNADSGGLLAGALSLVKAKRYRIVNVDATIVAQSPRLAGYIPEMKRRIAQILMVSEDDVNIKATTNEGMGAIGREEGLAAFAVALLAKT